jgi:hypothetical protein
MPDDLESDIQATAHDIAADAEGGIARRMRPWPGIA